MIHAGRYWILRAGRHRISRQASARELRAERSRGVWVCALFALLVVGGCTSISGGSAAPSGALARVAAAPLGEAQRPDLVVMISIPGLISDTYRDPPGAGSQAPMPTLRTLARAGVAAERIAAVVPPTGYPVHTTLVTGSNPAQHGVTADLRIGEHGVRREHYSHASLVHGATLWQAATATGGEVAALDWPATVGAAVAHLLPDVVPSRRGETWRALVEANATPWVHARVAADPRPAVSVRGAARDELLVDTACRLVASPAPPRLLLMRLGETEQALTRHGPGTPEAQAAFVSVDRRLARLGECLAGAGRLERTAWIVVGDRVFLPVHTALHVNQALVASGLLGRGRPWRAVVRSNGGSAFVYARDARAAVAARQALSEEAESTRAFRIVSAEEMIALGADPVAWFGLAAEPGYLFSDAPREQRVRPAGTRGASGYLPTDVAGAPRSGESPGFLAFGPGLRRGLRIPVLRQTDIAPTVARLLGASLSGAEGRPLLGALRLPAETAPGGATP